MDLPNIGAYMTGSRRLIVDPCVQNAIAQFTLPTTLGFGKILAPIMYEACYSEHCWGAGHLKPYGPIALAPCAKVFHYAQTLFEGMKAYRVNEEQTILFRPLKHWERMVASGKRLCMPELPQEVFMEGVNAVASCCEPYIPDQSGQMLYLRPFMFGTEATLGLGVSDTYSFVVVASPSDVYHTGTMRVLIEREEIRAAGMLGSAKAGSNYAASMYGSARAKEMGCDQPLWLDPFTRQNIEELSGMNFFAVIDGALHTPALSGSFLPGITRDSVIILGRSLGFEVVERIMPVEELIEDIHNGRGTEAFVTGTAAVICSISEISEQDGTALALKEVPGPVAQRIRQELVDIQEGRKEDLLGWVTKVPLSHRWSKQLSS
ncbi:MAG: branched-chain amino acid aminotransferase [Gammaproteobacteria bacterium]